MIANNCNIIDRQLKGVQARCRPSVDAGAPPSALVMVMVYFSVSYSCSVRAYSFPSFIFYFLSPLSSTSYS